MVNKKIKRVKLDFAMERCSDLMEHIRKADEKEQDIVRIIFHNAELNDEDLSERRFENVIFQDCSFENVVFSDCSFINVSFTNSVFTDCYFTNTRLIRCEIVQSKFNTTDFSKSRFMNITIDKSNLRYANFTSSQLENFEIVESNLSEPFFAECILKNFFPVKTCFKRADFFHTPLKEVDFTSCEIEEFCVSDNLKELQGIIVNPYQAADLSRLFGIIVKEE